MESPSSRRAWIEILFHTKISDKTVVALLAEGVDRNIATASSLALVTRSPSSRRAWIEISLASMF